MTLEQLRRRLTVRGASRTTAVCAVIGLVMFVAGFGASARTGGGTLVERASAAAAAENVAAAGNALSTTASAAITWDIANIDHQRVDFWVDRFTSSKRDEFGTYLARKGRYEAMISQKLAGRGMPQDLLYLAMIESGFNPKAYSRASASGLWQFMRATGERYGLDVNRAVDERRDPVKATDAALNYLEDLHTRFGSWYLAAAAYNCGENRVARAMRQVVGREKGTDQDYYRIWSRLPRETRDYVPLMIAAARISKQPEEHGFDSLEVSLPLDFSEVEVKPATSLASVAKLAGTTVAVIKELNPQLKLERTRNDTISSVRVPRTD